MSLIISNNATDKQLAFLKELGYCGDTCLTKAQAAGLIEEYLELQKDEQNKQYIAFEGERIEVF